MDRGIEESEPTIDERKISGVGPKPESVIGCERDSPSAMVTSSMDIDWANAGVQMISEFPSH